MGPKQKQLGWTSQSTNEGDRVKEALREQAHAVLGTIEPHERRAPTPARQISFSLTEEEHANFATNARKAGVTMRTLILRAIKPFTESVLE